MVEVEGNDSLSGIFNRSPLSAVPAELRKNLFAVTISAEEALQEYLDVKLHLKAISRQLMGSQFIDYVTHAAPGLRDLLLLGKVWYLATRHSFDLILLDTAASGHAVSMLRSPQGFLQAVPKGPLAQHAQQVLDWLRNPDAVSIYLVTTPEETPVSETIETAGLLEEQIHMDVSTVLVNMVYESASSDTRIEKAIQTMGGPEELVELMAGLGLTDIRATAQTLFEAGDFYRRRRNTHHRQRARLSRSLSKTAEIIELPYFFTTDLGVKEVERMAGLIEKRLAT